jgi:hypothetical protein
MFILYIFVGYYHVSSLAVVKEANDSTFFCLHSSSNVLVVPYNLTTFNVAIWHFTINLNNAQELFEK